MSNLQINGKINKCRYENGIRFIEEFELESISIIKNKKTGGEYMTENILEPTNVLFGFKREKLDEDDFVDCFYFTTRNNRKLGKWAILPHHIEEKLEELGFCEQIESTYIFKDTTENGIHLLETNGFVHDLNFQEELNKERD